MATEIPKQERYPESSEAIKAVEKNTENLIGSAVEAARKKGNAAIDQSLTPLNKLA